MHRETIAVPLHSLLCAAQRSAAQRSAEQRSAALRRAVQRSAAQRSAAQCSAAQRSALPDQRPPGRYFGAVRTAHSSADTGEYQREYTSAAVEHDVLWCCGHHTQYTLCGTSRVATTSLILPLVPAVKRTSTSRGAESAASTGAPDHSDSDRQWDCPLSQRLRS